MSNREQLVASLRPLSDRCWHGHCWVKTPNGPRRIDDTFTAVHLSEHVMGAKVYGLCPIAPGTSVTYAACLDFDSHKGETPWPEMWRTAELVIATLELDGYTPMAFRSSGGAGIHVYLIWDKEQDAYSVREMLRGVLASCGLASGTAGVSKGEVEVFPKQDDVPVDGFGNMFILPLAGKSQSTPLTEPFVWVPSTDVPVLERPARVAPATQPTRAEHARLKSALDAIPNTGTEELDYDAWRNIIFALHYATEGSADGLALAHEFSARSSKYDPEFLDTRVWPYIRSDRGGAVVTDRSLYALAEHNGWADPLAADDFDVIGEVVGDTTEGGTQQKGAGRFAPVPAHLFAQGKPPSWLIKGVMPDADLIVVYGESGSGKSFWVTDAVAAIGRGVPWRGRKVKQGSVVYIVAEGSGGFKPRLNAYAAHNAAPLEDIGMHIIAAAPNFTAKEDIIELVNSIRALKPSVVVVDTLSRVLSGADENSGEDMGRVVKHCETIRKVTGATVILIHHSGKDATRGARGWSGLRAAADAEIEILRSDHDRVARITKQKDGDDVAQEFGFTLSIVEVGRDEDDEPVSSCVVVHGQGSAPAGKRAKLGVNEQVLLRCLPELSELAGEDPDVASLIDHGVAQVPFDAGAGRRDKRRENMLRALQSLQAKGLVVMDGGRVQLKADAQ